MGRGLNKRKTLVVNIITGEEIEFNSRLDACKYTGIERKSLNGYMHRGGVYNKTFKFIDISE